jgi:hypothetical protein
MSEKIHDSFSAYGWEDRHAIGTYLVSLPPNPFDPENWGMVKRARKKEARSAARP